MFSKKLTRSALGALLALALVSPLLAGVAAVPVEAEAAPAETAAPVESAAPVEETPAAESAEPVKTYPVRVNGVAMTEDPMVVGVNGVTYVSARAIAQALDPMVQTIWDGKTAKLVHWGLVDLYATPGMNYVIANERYLFVPNLVQVQNGSILLPLDVVCKVFDATYVYNPGDCSFDLTTGSGALTPGWQFYNSEDLTWLSHIIYAESGNQPLSGKIAVGNVVLNRVKDSRFPNTVKGVVFQRNQFTPAATGAIYRTPNAESVLAAKLCLDGAVSLNNVLWFNQKGLHTWASSHRAFVATIAGHSFYA